MFITVKNWLSGVPQGAEELKNENIFANLHKVAKSILFLNEEARKAKQKLLELKNLVTVYL